MSLRLQALEEKLGVRLLDRGPRDVRLTSAGRSLLPEVRALLDMHDRMVSRLSASPVVGPIRLGIGKDCVATFLPRLMRDISKDCSGVRLDILCRTSGCLQRMIEAHKLDLAVLILPGNAVSGLNLCRPNLQWVGSPGFALDLRLPVPLVWHEKDSCFRASGTAALESSGISYREVLFGSDERVGLAAVEAGTAVTVMAEGTVRALLKPLCPHSGLPQLGQASVRLLERPGAESAAAEAVKRNMVKACRGAGRRPHEGRAPAIASSGRQLPSAHQSLGLIRLARPDRSSNQSASRRNGDSARRSQSRLVQRRKSRLKGHTLRQIAQSEASFAQ